MTLSDAFAWATLAACVAVLIVSFAMCIIAIARHHPISPTAQGEHMSLEENVSALTDAVTLLNDTIQNLAATLRGAQTGPAPVVKDEGLAETTKAPGKSKTTKVKEPPPSPSEAAASITKVTASQDSAPAAESGSPELTYADLADVVPKVAEKHGRAKAVELFGKLGVTGGKQLQADFPKKIPEAVRLFRAALAE